MVANEIYSLIEEVQEMGERDEEAEVRRMKVSGKPGVMEGEGSHGGKQVIKQMGEKDW